MIVSCALLLRNLLEAGGISLRSCLPSTQMVAHGSYVVI